MTTTRRVPWGKRPDTPVWLKTFAKKLHGNMCILCGRIRPLVVAHLDNWTAVNKAIIEYNIRNAPLNLSHDEDAFWIFHQPWNVAPLCRLCHEDYDDETYLELTRGDILAARDKSLATERAALVMLEYFCNGMRGTVGSRQHANVANRWFRLLDWLKGAAESGLLPEPHRFLLNANEVVDVTQALILSPPPVDEPLPVWNGKGFDPPTQRQNLER